MWPASILTRDMPYTEAFIAKLHLRDVNVMIPILDDASVKPQALLIALA
jgi:hypothetical protein